MQQTQALRALAASIRREGLLEPLLVEEISPGQFRLLDGEKRYQACRMIGMTHAEVIVTPGAAPVCSVGDMVDALLGGQLHYLDQAQLLHRLQTEAGMRSELLAGLLGVTPESVAQRITLLSLEPQLAQYLRESGLPEAHAYQLMRLPAGEQRMQVAHQAAEGRLGVRDVELLVRSLLMRTPQPGRTISVVRDYRLYANAIRSMVDQMVANGVSAQYDEKREGTTLVITVRLPIRRQRRQSRCPS